MAFPPNPASVLGYYCGDQPSDWMSHGQFVYVSTTGNNAVYLPIEHMVAADPGTVTVQNLGDIFVYDSVGSKAVGTWRWTP